MDVGGRGGGGSAGSGDRYECAFRFCKEPLPALLTVTLIPGRSRRRNMIDFGAVIILLRLNISCRYIIKVCLNIISMRVYLENVNFFIIIIMNLIIVACTQIYNSEMYVRDVLVEYFFFGSNFVKP